MSWGWNTEFGQVDVWRGFACIHNSLTQFSFFLPNIYRLRVGAVASAYSLLVIPWDWSNGFGQVDVWMIFAYLDSILVVVFLSCSTSIGLGCAVSAPLSAGRGNFKSQISKRRDQMGWGTKSSCHRYVGSKKSGALLWSQSKKTL